MSIIFPSAAAAVILYFFTGFRLARRLFQRTADERAKHRLIILGLVATFFHAVVLAMTIFTKDGINLPFFYSASLLTWLISVIILCAAFRVPVENLGIIILPLAAVSLMLSLVFPPEHEGNTISTGLQGHILTSVLSYSLLSIAAIQAVLLAVQNHHLRHQHPGGFIRALPPLEKMESLLFQMIALGFGIQTLSLITGWLYLDDMFAQHKVHHTVLSITAWLVFAILLWGRYQFGWRGKIAIRWTLTGFGALLLAYFGSKLVWEIILGHG